VVYPMDDRHSDRLERMRRELETLRTLLSAAVPGSGIPTVEEIHELEGLRSAVRVLERSLQRFEAERNASKTASITVDADGRVVSWNRRFLEMFLPDCPIPLPDGRSLLERLDALCAEPGAVSRWADRPGTELPRALFLLRDGRRIVAEATRVDSEPPATVYEFFDVTGIEDPAHNLATLAEAARGAPFRLERTQRRWRLASLGPAIRAIAGLDPRQLVGQPSRRWTARVHTEDLAVLRRAFREALRTGRRADLEFRLWHEDGSLRRLAIRAVPIRDREGRVAALDGLVLDVTERKEDEENLRRASTQLRVQSEALDQRTRQLQSLNDLARGLQSAKSQAEAIRSLVRNAPKLMPDSIGAVYLNDPSGTTHAAAFWPSSSKERPPKSLAVRECWAACLGRPAEPDQPSPEMCRGCPNDVAKGRLCFPLSDGSPGIGFIHVRPAGPGFTPHQWALIRAACEQFALALNNIRLRDALREEAVRDPLTGLFNRRHLDGTVRAEFEHAVRHGEPTSVLMLDLDHFKQYNDRYGHEAGDRLLQALGRFLSQAVRADDVPCRYGGEEFTVVLRDAPLEVALERAEAIRKGIERLHLTMGRQVQAPVTASIGVASFPQHGKHFSGVLRSADMALLRAKREGRNRVAAANRT
jgi:diguanylate cyclase (GGDEF)-like protein/PAS domain S-box-containing protein